LPRVMGDNKTLASTAQAKMNTESWQDVVLDWVFIENPYSSPK
jgi:hypothetical protein